MSSTPLRWGLAAAGKITHDFVNAVQSAPSEIASKHTFVAVAARSGARAREFADRFGIEKSLEGYEALAAEKDVDAVYVAPIHPQHVAVAKIMIMAGKSVLLEKPIGMNLSETQDLVKLAREKKVFLMEAMWTRCAPQSAKLREEIAAGAIGKVIHVDATLGFDIKISRLFKKELGGGSMLDLGVYPVFFILQAFPGERPEKVTATGHLNEEGTDSYVTAVFIYSGGRSATLNIHSKCDLVSDAFVYGESGHIKAPAPFHNCPKLEVKGKMHEWPLPEGRLEYNYTNSAALMYEAEHVRECLEKGLTESPLVGLDESVLAAELMEKMRKQVGVVYPQDEQ